MGRGGTGVAPSMRALVVWTGPLRRCAPGPWVNGGGMGFELAREKALDADALGGSGLVGGLAGGEGTASPWSAPPWPVLLAPSASTRGRATRFSCGGDAATAPEPRSLICSRRSELWRPSALLGCKLEKEGFLPRRARLPRAPASARAAQKPPLPQVRPDAGHSSIPPRRPYWL